VKAEEKPYNQSGQSKWITHMVELIPCDNGFSSAFTFSLQTLTFKSELLHNL